MILRPILVILSFFERANDKFSFFGKIFGFHVKFAKNGPFNCENPFWAKIAYFGTFVLQTAINLAKIVFQIIFSKNENLGSVLPRNKKITKIGQGNAFLEHFEVGPDFRVLRFFAKSALPR